MKSFYKDEVKTCAEIMSTAKNPEDALAAWLHLDREHADLVGIVCLDSYKRSVLPFSIEKYMKEPLNYLVPYFKNTHIYFLDNEIVNDILNARTVNFGVDYSLMLDTNIASYINKLVRGESLGQMQRKIIPFIDELLNDNLNFDSLFYMMENVKGIINIINRPYNSKLCFWKKLKKDFRLNLVSLQVFRSIDCVAYKKTSNPKPEFSFTNAARRAIDFSYDFYIADNSRKKILNFVLIQRVILLHLIGMVNIQLSSNKNAKNKMAEYFAFVNEVVGIFFERESIIAHQYFLDRKKVSILEKFHKGMPKDRLLKKLDNIAWDMAAPRFMENTIPSMSKTGNGRYFIPMFVSFDVKLKELLSLYPIKGAIYSKTSGKLIPIPTINTFLYFEKNDCSKNLEYFFSDSVKETREKKPLHSRTSVHECIKHEYEKLRHTVSL